MNITRHTRKSYLLPCTPADLNRYDKFFGHYFISYHIYFRCGRDHRNPPRVINMSHLSGYIMSMASWKWDVTPVRWQWSHISCNKNDKNARSMIVSFLSNRRQRVKISVEVSNWSTIKRGVTPDQGSVLAFISGNIANYADDYHLYNKNVCVENLRGYLVNDAIAAVTCFHENQMVANAEKFKV